MKHILLVSFIFLLSHGSQAQMKHPEKIGIGTWESDKLSTSLTNVETLKFGWYYDWRTDHLWSPNPNAKRRVKFVPMIWGAKNANEVPSRQSGFLLGFNEPDNSTQAGMGVDQAIALWPKLLATGLRLGSPAPTADQAMGSSSWLGQFMAKAQQKKYRVDFMAVHYYSANKDVSAFKVYLERLHSIYKKPIWVTEWALVDWSRPSRFNFTETAAYAKEALVMLDSLPFVERHAWFSAIAYEGGIQTELFDSKNRLTPVGKVFKAALGSSANTRSECIDLIR